MNNYNPDKKYESYRIPERSGAQGNESVSVPFQKHDTSAKSSGNDVFYEIEYDSCPMPGVGRFVLKSQKVAPPRRDEVRELFYRMRDIAHDYRPSFYASNKFYDKRVQRENAKVFYKQGVFMQGFEDHYSKSVTYSSYFPNYQGMGYDQLRTYFTWRTLVRQGNVREISLSYAFLYIYELLNNIGVEDPADGLDKLLSFWRAFRAYDSSVDRYMPKWLKDYYIYYDIPDTFSEFVREQDLQMYYPELNDSRDKFDLFCEISKYDIRKSKFYTEDNEALVRKCFDHTFERFRQVLEQNGIAFEESVFQPTRNMAAWEPFKGALFYDWKNQRDRKVVFSGKEIYICSQNHWTCSSMITTESGKKLVGYVMKQMEVVLRKLTKYKFKLSADISTVTHEAVKILEQKGISLECVITEAVTEAYREATKTVVKVDPDALLRIRQEAFITQEKLTVPEEEVYQQQTLSTLLQQEIPAEIQQEETGLLQQKTATVLLQENAAVPEKTADAGPWGELKRILTETELQALICVLKAEGDIRQFADNHGIMLEVLMDGINEKAMDCVGDSLMDEEFILYEDYIEEVRKMVEEI